MSVPQIVILVALGLAPSLFWMSYFLKRDVHPEPKYLIAKVFLMGIIVAPLAVLFQWGFMGLGNFFSVAALAAGTPIFFAWAAFVEEFVKFYAVRLVALTDPEFDEPVDAMIYMIVAGLGFAAIENILVLFRSIADGTQATIAVWTLRSVGATLLHALACGILGYFLAMSWFFRHHAKKLVLLGLLLATMFHFTFNIFLSMGDNQFIGILKTVGLLLSMAFLVSILFDKIKERSSKTHKYTQIT